MNLVECLCKHHMVQCRTPNVLQVPKKVLRFARKYYLAQAVSARSGFGRSLGRGEIDSCLQERGKVPPTVELEDFRLATMDSCQLSL